MASRIRVLSERVMTHGLESATARMMENVQARVLSAPGLISLETLKDTADHTKYIVLSEVSPLQRASTCMRQAHVSGACVSMLILLILQCTHLIFPSLSPACIASAPCDALLLRVPVLTHMRQRPLARNNSGNRSNTTTTGCRAMPSRKPLRSSAMLLTRPRRHESLLCQRRIFSFFDRRCYSESVV